MKYLKYPEDLDLSKNDFIKFEHFPFELNDDLKGTKGRRLDRGGEAPQDEGSRRIILYMPNSTPSTMYGHSAQYQTFPGALGSFQKGILEALGDDYSNMKFNFDSDDQNSIISRLKNINEANNINSAGEGLYQYVMSQLAAKVNSDAATAIALGQGKVYNPNAEMIYNQPYHRRFDFNFDFTPQSRSEAIEVDEIIYEFKKWSAPKYEEAASSSFMEIPHLWRVSYHEAGGKVYRRMNLFKPALITNFGVQDNPNSNYHMTIKDDDAGHVPVLTSIRFTIQETSPPTRGDHKWAVDNGYRRGY